MISLNNENYFSKEAMTEYMSNSQFQDFKRCQAKALAKLKGEYVEETTTALLMGSYIDAYFSNELEDFKNKNKDMFLKDGIILKPTYQKCIEAIQRIEQDELFLSFLKGEAQVIETGIIAGVPFKIKIDSLHIDKIVDLKFMKDTQDIWDNINKEKRQFWDYWGYDEEMAIYQEIHSQQYGDILPCYLVVVTKETPCDIKIFKFSQETLDKALRRIKYLAPKFQMIKDGIIEAIECKKCDYYRKNKKLTEKEIIEI